jgi:hypothetical protein
MHLPKVVSIGGRYCTKYAYFSSIFSGATALAIDAFLLNLAFFTFIMPRVWQMRERCNTAPFLAQQENGAKSENCNQAVISRPPGAPRDGDLNDPHRRTHGWLTASLDRRTVICSAMPPETPLA